MTVRALALLSGGLDSMLAIRILQEQGIEVEALNFRTTFVCCQDQAARAAEELGVRLSVVTEQDDYLDLVKAPRHGYGRGANPCIDCRVYMFKIAARWMRQSQASLVISGEVVGQRPMSQKKRDLARIAHHAGLEDYLLRPLSARLLPPTLPERHKLVDREKLFGFSGRGRKELIALARQLGLRRIPQPSTGCALTEPRFAAKVYDLIGHDADADRWQFELLKVGRHLRFDRSTKIVLGRRADENEQLARLYAQRPSGPVTVVEPENFVGPTALIVGVATESAIDFTGALILRYTKLAEAVATQARVRSGSQEHVRPIRERADASVVEAI
jgi:PP-loop superfamily ATP-utilizing enzyme